MAASDSTKLHPVVQLGVCVGGIYVSFLVWALCQERLSTTPNPSTTVPRATDNFRAVLFLNTIQSAFSACSALAFLTLTKRRPGVSWRSIVGLPPASTAPTHRHSKSELVNGPNSSSSNKKASSLLKSYAFISLVSSMASPFGFLALSHISFPTLLLGKSCKLVPVMMMNIVLYRRKFPLHKYALVAMVTAGIWAFMAFKPSKGAVKGPATSSVLGLGLLGINLMLDGVVNATQDHVFSTYSPLDGPQMMFFMNVFSTVFTTCALLFPTALTPAFLLPASASPSTHVNALTSALEFVASHPSVKLDILLFALTGAVGQLFIFATLSKYGSLTLVTITVTRKMCTMLLSVFVFNHRLAAGQWAGTGIVFVAVAMEAQFARKEKARKAVAGGGGGRSKKS